jgi:hypothetical protein
MLCVYGVVRADAPPVETRGVHRGIVTIVPAGPVAALVSPLDGELLARRRDVEAHLDVVETAFRAGAVLPFRFGTVVDDEDAMRRVLAENEADYVGLLEQLDGLVQMTLKAVRSDDDAIRTVVAADDRLRRVVRRLQGSTTVADQLQLGEQVATAVALLSERDAREITARVTGMARAAVLDEVASPTVVSIALLLHPDEASAMDRTVARLMDDYGSRLSFDYAGPMPPYSFVG